MKWALYDAAIVCPRIVPSFNYTGAIWETCGTRTVVLLQSHCTIVSSTGADGRKEVKAFFCFYKDKQERAAGEANHPHSTVELPLRHRTDTGGNPTRDDTCTVEFLWLFGQGQQKSVPSFYFFSLEEESAPQYQETYDSGKIVLGKTPAVKCSQQAASV